jgi:DNA-directed RNA polymerase specialized sigma24 family protein
MTRDGYGRAYQKGFDLTVRFLLSRGIQRDAATEVAQAAWVRGWEHRGQLRNESFVVTWVNTIALNVYRSSLRSQALNRELPEIQDRAVAINLAAIDAGRVLNSCRPRDRMLLEQYMNGFTMAEIASQENVTETAVRIRLLRARRAARCRAEKKVAPLHDRFGAARDRPRAA